MKENKFVELARQYFGEVLLAQGFENSASKYCTYYRKVSDGLYHVVLVEQGKGGSWFDVRVYATSPLIEPDFDSQFPDYLGIPTGNSSFLHPKFGVCHRNKTFPCKTEEGFVRNFNKEIKPVLERDAIQYLDKIQTLGYLIALINHPFYLGMAEWHSGNKEKGKEILMSEKERLLSINDDTGRIASLIQHIEKVLPK